MTVTDNTTRTDARVTPYRDGFLIEFGLGDPTYRVSPHNVLGWAIHHAYTGELHQAPGGGGALGYQTADDAIAALLAEPAP